MKDVERLLGFAVEPVKTLDYGPGSTHEVVLVAHRDEPSPRYVVKRARGDPGPLIRERLALESYAEHPDARALVPGVVAASESGELLVVEALPIADSDRLGAILEGDDPERARNALLAHVRALAVLNSAPVADPFARRVTAHGPLTSSRHAVNYWSEHVAALSERLSALCGRAGGIAEEAAQATDRMLAGPAALSHGDGTAANTFVTEAGRAYVIDFETAAVRHPAMDGAFGRIRDLNSVWALELPAPLREEATRAYRDTLAPGPDWESDETAAAAVWLAILLRRPERYMDHDQRWGESGLRWRVFTGLERFAEIARTNGEMPSTADACERGVAALRNRWSDEDRTARTYRAFARQ